jgi:hypothetical protein
LAVFFVALCSLFFFSFAKPQRIGEARGVKHKAIESTN